MHPFCRFCSSPADKAISLEDLGAERLQKWALLNLGLEVYFCPGFSTSICWACVTTFQDWAGMVKARATCAGDEHLASQDNWWEEIPSNKCFVNFENGPRISCPMEISSADDLPLPSQPLVDLVRPEVPQLEPASEGTCPIIEAIHTPVDIKNCCVKLTSLDNNFIQRSCQGLIKLNALPPNFPDQDNSLTCCKCRVVVKSRTDMKVHNAKVHPDLKPCPVCLKTFKPQLNLTQHLTECKRCNEDDSEDLAFLCPRCPESTADFASHVSHFQRKHAGAKLADWTHPCWRCNQIYFEKKQLMDHFKHIHQTTICRHCNGHFKNNVALMLHTASYHQEVKFSECFKMCPGSSHICIVCDAKFSDEPRVAKHYLQYHSDLTCLLERPDELETLAEKVDETGAQKKRAEVEQDSLAILMGYSEEVLKETRNGPAKRLMSISKMPACHICKKTFYRKYALKKHLQNHAIANKNDSNPSVQQKAKLNEKRGVKHLKLSPDLNKTSCEPEVVQKSADVNKAEKIALRPRQEISENIHMDKTKCKPRILVKTSKHTASFPCKLCNGNYTRQFSLLRHILCKHKEFAKCQSCLEEISTGSICAKHKVAESTINSTTVDHQNPNKNEAAIETSTQSDIATVEPESSGAAQSDTSRRTLSFKTKFKCPGCRVSLPSIRQLKLHTAACMKASVLAKLKVKKMSHSKISGVRINATVVPKKIDLDCLQNLHPGEAKIPCLQCDFTCSKESELAVHMHTLHSVGFEDKTIKVLPRILKPIEEVFPSKFKCPHCSRIFDGLNTLESHASSEHPANYHFVCLLCPERRKFTFQLSLSLHIQTEHAKDPTPLIWFTEEARDAPPSSSPSHNSTQSVADGEHGYGVSPKKVEEVVTIEDEKTVSSNLAEKDADSDETLSCPSSPINIADEEVSKDNLKCNLCDLICLDLSGKKKHMETFHYRRSEPLPCSKCKQIFTSKIILQIHSSRCKGPKKVDQVAKVVAEEVQLKLPKQVPDVDVTISCKKVSPAKTEDHAVKIVRVVSPNKDSKNKTGFMDRVRSGPLPCILCNQMFSSRMVLQIHMSSCKGPKKSPKLKKSESQATYSNRKMPIAVPEICLLTCNLCSQKFSSQQLFQEHLFESHKISLADNKGNLQKLDLQPATPAPSVENVGKTKVLYKCNRCGNFFMDRDVLVRHLTSHHTP